MFAYDRHLYVISAWDAQGSNRAVSARLPSSLFLVCYFVTHISLCNHEDPVSIESFRSGVKARIWRGLDIEAALTNVYL